MPSFFCAAALLINILASLMLQAPALATDTEKHAYLQVKNAEGTIVFSMIVNNAYRFGIRFVHSVAQSPVEEWFSVENGTIFLEKTVYHDFGAGLPHEPGPGQKMTCSDGHLSIEGYHRELRSFDVRVGRIAHHTLLLPTFDNVAAIPLTCLASPGKPLTFTVSTTAPKQ
ncbi:MAG: DUF1850 domain-containing protein [Desulfovibrio sp.]|nr:DUF1850 domain-containing protein [Desulfovibrio sp.]